LLGGFNIKVHVLRLDHRTQRDARITTHVCLTARALGASGIFLSGDQDEKVIENVRDVVNRWGGDFKVEYRKDWYNLMKDWKTKDREIIHLTMYGELVQEVVENIRRSSKDKLVVVGSSRVPSKVYQKADWNIAVTNQPHSEVSSLALFLHLLNDGKELEFNFSNGEMQVIPSAKGKTVIKREKEI